jgi:hypothetical protein
MISIMSGNCYMTKRKEEREEVRKKKEGNV